MGLKKNGKKVDYKKVQLQLHESVAGTAAFKVKETAKLEGKVLSI